MEKRSFIITETTLEGLKSQMSLLSSQIAEIVEKPDNTKWLSEGEVLKLIGMCSKTLRSYRNSGVLPYSKLGRKIFYKSEDIDEFISTGYRKSRLSEFISKNRNITFKHLT